MGQSSERTGRFSLARLKGDSLGAFDLAQNGLMASTELLNETHDLLKRLLEIEDRNAKEAKELKEQWDRERPKLFSGFDTGDGATEASAKMGDDERSDSLAKRLEQRQAQTDRVQASTAAYQEATIAELKRQTELLERIAAKLGA